jgi:hypothetical protein
MLRLIDCIYNKFVGVGNLMGKFCFSIFKKYFHTTPAPHDINLGDVFQHVYVEVRI